MFSYRSFFLRLCSVFLAHFLGFNLALTTPSVNLDIELCGQTTSAVLDPAIVRNIDEELEQYDSFPCFSLH